MPFPTSVKNEAYPPDMFIWVGPDGIPICRDNEADLIQLRRNVFIRQSFKKKTAKIIQDLGLLAKKSYFCILDPDPPAIMEAVTVETPLKGRFMKKKVSAYFLTGDLI